MVRELGRTVRLEEVVGELLAELQDLQDRELAAALTTLTSLVSRVSDLASNWARFSPNGTNLGLFKISYLKSPRFVPFSDNLTQLDAKCAHQTGQCRQSGGQLPVLQIL